MNNLDGIELVLTSICWMVLVNLCIMRTGLIVFEEVDLHQVDWKMCSRRARRFYLLLGNQPLLNVVGNIYLSLLIQLPIWWKAMLTMLPWFLQTCSFTLLCFGRLIGKLLTWTCHLSHPNAFHFYFMALVYATENIITGRYNQTDYWRWHKISGKTYL